MKGDRGLTLLELVIAVAVLSIGTLAALRSTDAARTGIAQSGPRLFALIAAENRAQELRLLGPNAGRSLPALVQMGGGSVSVQVSYSPTAAGLVRAEIHARHESGPGALLVAYLPGRGMQ